MPSKDISEEYDWSGSLEVPASAKPIGYRPVSGLGLKAMVERFERNIWPEHKHPSHFQVMFVIAPGVCLARWRDSNGTLTKCTVEPNHVWILPPGWRHSLQWNTPADVIILYVASHFVRRYFTKAETTPVVRSFHECISVNPEIGDLCAELRGIRARKGTLADWYIAGLGTQLAAAVMEAHFTLCHRAPQATYRLSDRVVDRAQALVADGIATQISAEEFARRLGVSGRHFRRLFRRVTGKSFQEFVAFNRTKCAVRLLRSGGYNVSEAAEAAGFSDTSYLNRCMRRFYGVSPSAFVPRHQWPDHSR